LTGEDGDDFQYFHGKFGDFKGKPMNFPVFLDFEWFAFGASSVVKHCKKGCFWEIYDETCSSCVPAASQTACLRLPQKAGFNEALWVVFPELIM